MTHSKHTPGPWTIEADGSHIMIGASGNGTIAVMRCPLSGTDKTKQANARLIAAAPEMLAELVKQRDWLLHVKPQINAPESVMLGFDQSIKYLDALIAKARGK